MLKLDNGDAYYFDFKRLGDKVILVWGIRDVSGREQTVIIIAVHHVFIARDSDNPTACDHFKQWAVLNNQLLKRL